MNKTKALNLSHLSDKAKQVMSWDNESRIRWIQEVRWFPYSNGNRILERMEKLINSVAKDRFNGMLITAEPNNGKSSLVRKFAEKYQASEREDGTGTYVPVVLVDAPSITSLHWLLNDILASLNAPYRGSADIGTKVGQIKHLFSRLGVKMLIIDEITDIVGGSAIKQRDVIKTIKQIGTRCRIPVVLSGTPPIRSAIAIDDQTRSRFKFLEIPDWEANLEFIRLLAGYEQIAPLKYPSNLKAKENRDIATLIHEKSNGRIGWIMEILEEAVEKAIVSGEEKITKEIINEIDVQATLDIEI